MYKIKLYRKYVQVENKRIELYYGTQVGATRCQPTYVRNRALPYSTYPHNLLPAFPSQLPFDFSLLNNHHLTARSFDFSTLPLNIAML